MCRNRKQPSSLSPSALDSRTNERMSKSRLWITMTFLHVTTTTCHGSDCLPVTCMYVIQGLGPTPYSAVIEGWMSVPPREKENCPGACFPTSQHLEFRSLEEQPCPADELREGLQRSRLQRGTLLSSGHPWKLQGGGQGSLCRSPYWHDLHIDWKHEDDDSNGVLHGKYSAGTVTAASFDFNTFF